MKNYYRILGVTEDAGFDQIRRAYRNQAFRQHPDRNKAPGAHERFVAIVEAYEVLSKPERRAPYDEWLRNYRAKDGPKQESTQWQAEKEESPTYEWANKARAKAEAYAATKYDVFARQLLRDIGLGINYLPNLLAIVMVLVAALGLLVLLFSEIDDLGGGILLLFGMDLGLFYLAYRLYEVAKSDFQVDRKQKKTY